MIKVQVDMVLQWSWGNRTEIVRTMITTTSDDHLKHKTGECTHTDTTPFSNFHCHRSWDNITRCKIFCSRGISFHEPLTLTVPKNTTFTPGTWKQMTETVL
jgi:hypothetical protein